MENKLARLEQYSARCAYAFSLNELFTWENRQILPSKGFSFRDSLAQAYNECDHAWKTGSEAQDLLAWFEENPPQDIEHQAMVRDLRCNLQFSVVPPAWVAERSRIISEATLAWEKANRQKDVRIWLPYVQQIMDNSHKIAECVNDAIHPLEFWIQQQEFGMTLTHLEGLFSDIVKGTAPLLEQNHPTLTLVKKPKTIQGNRQKLLSLCKRIAVLAGYNDQVGTWAETRLPFSSIIGPQDVRIAVNFSSVLSAISGSLHEVGHAVYALGADPKLHQNGLWRPFIGGYDEAMAIFWECMVGQSEEFWSFLFPILCLKFPEFSQWSDKDILSSFFTIDRSPLRVGSDQVTYLLHILIRYRLEKELLTGNLKAADLPEAWKHQYQEVLKITPANDNEGCLQDVHWSLGLIGYFPSYALGSLMAAQIYSAAKRTNVMENITRGDFEPLNLWLANHFYQKGRLETPDQIIRDETGESLNATFLIDHLNQRFVE